MKKKILLGLVLLVVVISLVFLYATKNSDNYFTFQNQQLYSVKKITLDKKLEKNNRMVIAYDSNKIYFGEQSNSFKIISVNLNNNDLEETLYESKEKVTISFIRRLNGAFYIAESNIKDGKIHFRLIRLDDNGIVKVLMNKKLINKLPYIVCNDKYIYVNSSNIKDNIYKSYLESIYLDNLEHELIEYDVATINKDGSLNGDVIVYCGGYEDVYYQVVELKDEKLELGGTSIIKQYCHNNKTNRLISVLKDKVQFITGDNSYLFVSEYFYNYKDKVIGKIFSKDFDAERFQEIPQVIQGFDLIGSKKIDNYIVLYNNMDLYIYDENLSKYNYFQYRHELNDYSDILFYNKTFAYVESGENDLTLCIYSFD